jgi:hypothetical protein
VCQGVFPDKKTADLQLLYGASRTRTGDLLGAISALSWPEFGLTSGFLSAWAGSPNTFPNSLQLVRHYDNTFGLGHDGEITPSTGPLGVPTARPETDQPG